MPPRERPAEAFDSDNPPVGVLFGPSRISDAEVDELARAEARAEAARARAIRLRAQAEAASSEHSGRSEAEDTSGERDVSATHGETDAEPPSARRWRRRPSRKAVAVAAALVVMCASLTASGYVVWHHRNVVQQRQRAAEFAAEARSAVLTMMSIDADKTREEMQRFADETTGPLKAGFLMGAEDLVKAVEQSKASSKATVKAVAVESMTQDSAIVLVAAKSEVSKPGRAEPESQPSRIIVTVKRDAGQLKVSRIEFVP